MVKVGQKLKNCQKIGILPTFHVSCSIISILQIWYDAEIWVRGVAMMVTKKYKYGFRKNSIVFVKCGRIHEKSAIFGVLCTFVYVKIFFLTLRDLDMLESI